MNSGLIGALGTPPLQTVKSRLGRFRGQSYTKIAENSQIIVGKAPNENPSNNIAVSPEKISITSTKSSTNIDLLNFNLTSLSRTGKIYWWANYGLALQAVGDIFFSHSSGVGAWGGQIYPLTGNLDLGQSSGSSRYISNIYSKAPHQFLQQNTPGSPLIDCAQIYSKNVNGTASMFIMNEHGNERPIGGYILTRTTSDNTPSELFLNGTSTRLTISSGRFCSFFIKITGIKADLSAASVFYRKVNIKNVLGTTSLVGAIETIGTDYEDNPSTDISITADDPNDALKIEVTGITGETWRWYALIEGSEIV